MRTTIVVLVLALLAACGDEPAPTAEVGPSPDLVGVYVSGSPHAGSKLTLSPGGTYHFHTFAGVVTSRGVWEYTSDELVLTNSTSPGQLRRYRVADGELHPIVDDSPPRAHSIQPRSLQRETLRIPPWAKVAPDQIADAKKHGVPVAFENDVGMRFVLIPAGTFRMGSPDDEVGHWEDEPLREVTLTRPYYVQTTEVTNAQYRQWRPDHESRPSEGAALNGNDQPVTWVSSLDAMAFSEWLSTRDAEHTYRLPTEAEWEHACRAGTTTPFSTGGTIAPGKASYNATVAYDDGPVGAERPQTTIAGSFAPNAWGLHDMHGNVWEWCSDWWAGTPSAEPTTDPRGPSRDEAELIECVAYDPQEDTVVLSGEEAAARVLRGGSFQSLPANLRSANRARHEDRGRVPGNGFRLVSPLPEKAE